ncbi:MAG: D-glycero-beta-D-manno-heptose 1,7-bisphosphate 7-phosphatase [Nitrospirae bacterium]|nr:D-glycero-beta-D-manno-heptose 1,7-bisphosphate 7-phosphatase [Nitrospirota bacterium]
MKKIAVFIDRDGTINEETGYVDSLDKFRLLPGVTDAIRALNQNDIPAILITNQSGIARGYFTTDFLKALHEKMHRELEKNGCRLDGIYLCPHHPDEDCACRKPKPGMLLRAAREKGIGLHNSYVIGDKIIDVELAHRVGAKGILVLTGYGAEELRNHPPISPFTKGGNRGMGGWVIPVGTELNSVPDHVAANLYEAVTWILGQVAGSSEQAGGENSQRFQSPATRYLLPATSKRILIVKPSSLGDIIHSLPVLWELRRLYPEAYIGWVVKEVWKDIIADNPLLDEIIVLKKGVRGFFSAIRHIHDSGYDTVIDLQGLFRSGAISLLSGASERIGFSNARELACLLYNHKVTVPPGTIHAVDRYLLAIEKLLSSQDPLNPPESPRTPLLKRGVNFPLYVDIEDAKWVKDFLRANNLSNAGPIIAVNPFARWEKKRWPISSYAALINQLIQELKAGIIILGGKEDIPLAEEISSLVAGRPAVAAGKTSLKTLTALLERVDLLVTNDSGPMHIAAALGTPVIALFGPTNPGLTGPYGKGHIVIRQEMECSPCLRRPCLHGRPLCMEAITIEEVMEAVKAKLESSDGVLKSRHSRLRGNDGS